MSTKRLLLGLVVGSMCVSCGSGTPQDGAGRGRRDTLAGTADTTKKPARNEDREVRLPQAPITPSAAPGDPYDDPATGALGGPAIGIDPPAQAPADAGAPEMPLAPKEAQWTIYCATVGGGDHMAMAKALKASLIQNTGMREWYIVSDNAQSRLYYGFYRSIADPADPVESKRAKGDRRKIDELVDKAGERPFRACQFVQLSAPDPESPPEWNLANAPQDKVWTLLIAAYKDHPDRKKAAVESVRDARARGEEAYYYHGDTVSNVFVGAWPEDAVLEEKVDAKEGVGAQDPLLVLPPGMKVPGKVRRKGQAVRAVGQQLVPVDEGLKQKIEQYPHMGVNGSTLVYKQNGRIRVQGPVIAPIPRPDETLFGADMGDEAEDGVPDDFRRGRDSLGIDGDGGGNRPAAPAGAGTTPRDDSPEGPGGRPTRRLRGVGDR